MEIFNSIVLPLNFEMLIISGDEWIFIKRTMIASIWYIRRTLRCLFLGMAMGLCDLFGDHENLFSLVLNDEFSHYGFGAVMMNFQRFVCLSSICLLSDVVLLFFWDFKATPLGNIFFLFFSQKRGAQFEEIRHTIAMIKFNVVQYLRSK